MRSSGQRSRTTSRRPTDCSSASAARSGSVTCVWPMYASGSKTSSSVGAMFMSPQTTVSSGPWATTSRSARSHSSLYS
jgi:hypothetical protein